MCFRRRSDVELGARGNRDDPRIARVDGLGDAPACIRPFEPHRRRGHGAGATRAALDDPDFGTGPGDLDAGGALRKRTGLDADRRLARRRRRPLDRLRLGLVLLRSRLGLARRRLVAGGLRRCRLGACTARRLLRAAACGRTRRGPHALRLLARDDSDGSAGCGDRGSKKQESTTAFEVLRVHAAILRWGRTESYPAVAGRVGPFRRRISSAGGASGRAGQGARGSREGLWRRSS
jgi:hypothetical protein